MKRGVSHGKILGNRVYTEGGPAEVKAQRLGSAPSKNAEKATWLSEGGYAKQVRAQRGGQGLPVPDTVCTWLKD